MITGSPADRAGIRAGDRITEVDGQPTANLSTDQAADLLQGQEGSIVEITTLTPAGALRRLRVRREHVDVPSVDDVKIIDRDFGVGYLKLTCFQKTTSRDLDAALWKLHRDGMKSLIIDLRGNPGGLLTSSRRSGRQVRRRRDHRLDPRPQLAGRLQLHGPQGRHLARAAGAC